ncbi:MAG: PepSY domain-containing protein [Acidobacteriia bacterium]|nr:PepSY domain-containing protein [Terriglobia bacterium]
MRVFASLGLILLLSACSETPTETKVKEPAKPPAPITAQQAFRYTYPAARAWAGDSLPLRIRSIHLTDVPAERGKAGAWEITYVSASQQTARIYTWSAIEASETLHKDVFAGKPQAWSGSSGQEKPFEAGAFHTDTPAALETAMTNSKEYLGKPGTKPAVNFLLEFTPRFPDPVWRVMWGETAGSAQYTVFVDADTGQIVGKG